MSDHTQYRITSIQSCSDVLNVFGEGESVVDKDAKILCIFLLIYWKTIDHDIEGRDGFVIPLPKEQSIRFPHVEAEFVGYEPVRNMLEFFIDSPF